MVTPICGFKDSQGKFHPTEEEALDADVRFRVEDAYSKARQSIDGFYYGGCSWRGISHVLDMIYDNPESYIRYFEAKQALEAYRASKAPHPQPILNAPFWKRIWKN